MLQLFYRKLSWIIILFFSVSAFGQLATMDQIPTIRQSKQSTGTTVAYPNNVVSGNILVGSFHTNAAIATPTLADTCGSTFTLRITQGTTNTWLYTWTATAACSGANTLTVTQSGGTGTQVMAIEIAHCTELVDTSATATNAVASGAIAFPNVTTSFYRDLILTIGTGGIGGTTAGTNNAAYTYASITSQNPQIYAAYTYSGNPGTVTGTSAAVTGGNGNAASEGVLALRSTSSLTVSTPSIPDAVSGTAYSFQMQATGGTGTNVWSTTAGSLPCGLTLSSGGVISGTPTCSNGNSITFQVQDAAAATATKSLTVHVGTSTNTIAKLQSKTNTVGSATAFTSNIASGSLILVGVAGGATVVIFDSAIVTDTRGTIFTEIPQAVISCVQGNARFIKFYWGFSTSSGADTVTVTPSGNGSFISEWSNVQPIFDTGVISLVNSSAGGATITSGSITVPVSETLYATLYASTSSATMTANSPYTQDVNFAPGSPSLGIEGEYEIGGASGSRNATWGISSNTSNQTGTLIFGFRPTTSGTAVTGNCPACDLSWLDVGQQPFTGF